MRFIIVALLILLAGCKSGDKESEPDRANAPALAWQNEEWTRYLIHQIEGNYAAFDVARDAASYCAGYGRLSRAERVVVWAHIFVALAKYESGYKPSSKMAECSSKPGKYRNERYVTGYGYCMVGGHKLDGNIVISRGLFQMSLSSAQSYGCDVSKPDDLHDPMKNIACAVRIFSKWVSKDKVVQGKNAAGFLGGARYWAPLRPGHHAEDIKAAVNKTEICN